MIQRGQQTPLFHRFVRSGDTLYVSGVIAKDLSQTIGGQTREISDRLADILGEAGSDMGRILQSTVYITDMSMKAEMNEAWKASFPAETLPTRATIGVADLGPSVLIEVVFVCAV